MGYLKRGQVGTTALLRILKGGYQQGGNDVRIIWEGLTMWTIIPGQLAGRDLRSLAMMKGTEQNERQTLKLNVKGIRTEPFLEIVLVPIRLASNNRSHIAQLLAP
jgi:hypothetical protein